MASNTSSGPYATFEADDQVAGDAAAYAERAVELARTRFNVTLDYSESSVPMLEQMARAVDRARAAGQIPDTQRPDRELGAPFGFYIGEVYRRNHGATWGFVNVEGQRIAGFQTSQGAIWWPLAKAGQRLRGDPSDNLAYYYHVVCHPDQGGQTRLPNGGK